MFFGHESEKKGFIIAKKYNTQNNEIKQFVFEYILGHYYCLHCSAYTIHTQKCFLEKKNTYCFPFF